MDALDLLTTRRSVRELVEPAPDELELETVFQAATQVPDHGNLTPWRFVVITGSEAKQKFRRALEETVEVMKLGEDAMRKAEKVANFAPMIIAVIAAPNTAAEKPKRRKRPHHRFDHGRHGAARFPERRKKYRFGTLRQLLVR